MKDKQRTLAAEAEGRPIPRWKPAWGYLATRLGVPRPGVPISGVGTTGYPDREVPTTRIPTPGST